MASPLSGLTFGVLAPRVPRNAPRRGKRVPLSVWLRPRRPRHLLGVAISLLFAASMWFYVQGVLIPYQKADAVRFGKPRGNLSDLYPRWLGARELFVHGRDPYSQQVTREIQVGYYGRALDPGRPNDPKDQAGFAYPVYVVFLLAPFIHLDFALVRSAFTWVLAGLVLASTLLWLNALGWHFSRSAKLMFLLLTVGSFPAAQAIKLQQLTILVAALMAAAAAALSAGWLAVAGLLLAVSTIKPQLVAPLLIFLLLWVVGDWRKRWPLFLSFVLSMACLIIGGELLLPGWIPKFISALVAYREYAGGISILQAMLTPLGGNIATGLLLGLLTLLGWTWRHEPAGSSRFGLMLSLSVAMTVLIIPVWSPYNQILLFPGVFFLLRNWRVITRFGTLPRLLYLMVAGLVIWPWIATLYLSSLWFTRPPAVVQGRVALPVATSLLIPFGIVALLGIYALQRWAGRVTP
jgi:hypothetical protein